MQQTVRSTMPCRTDSVRTDQSSFASSSWWGRPWAIVIPADESLPISLIENDESLILNEQKDSAVSTSESSEQDPWLKQALARQYRLSISAESHANPLEDDGTILLTSTLLLRPSVADATTPSHLRCGLSAYSLSSTRIEGDNEDGDVPPFPNAQTIAAPNVRATRFAMACGMFHLRFRGTALLAPCSKTATTMAHVSPQEILEAVQLISTTSPDVRVTVLAELQPPHLCDSKRLVEIAVPEWLGNAAQQNYHDQAVLTRLANVMAASTGKSDEVMEADSDSESQDESDLLHGGSGVAVSDSIVPLGIHCCPQSPRFAAVANSPLCLHCRRPTNRVCPNCHGAYFCNETCRSLGWSHDCICPTWKLYVSRRTELSQFGGLGHWCSRLFHRDCQLSDDPYHEFLSQQGINRLGTTWWCTEFSGWLGGEGDGAREVDPSRRLSFQQGFDPVAGIPAEQHVIWEEPVRRNELGLGLLESWDNYYQRRGIPNESIAALLLSFPLTLYHAIVEFAQVPCMVARILKRPLRIHIVGAEKELNFLDLWKETVYLLPEDIALELVFITRDDMLPLNLRLDPSRGREKFRVSLLDNLTVRVYAGSYGDSLDPMFDLCGSPDMIVGFNAGLYAYPSWRPVIQFLRDHKDVLGIFTDYNEMSAVQCGSLGGAAGRSSVRVNPFRQPRAMPVYSMNLPQVSNGFFYVFNQQELE